VAKINQYLIPSDINCN